MEDPDTARDGPDEYVVHLNTTVYGSMRVEADSIADAEYKAQQEWDPEWDGVESFDPPDVTDVESMEADELW